jgi:hypothetical protein
MAVYVDNMRAPLGRMIMCHMIADTHAELMRMVHAIGLEARHIQDAGTHREHFDISLHMKKRAIARGAIEITTRQLATKCQRKRGNDVTL